MSPATRHRIWVSLYGLLGVAAVACGLYQWWPPGAWMFAGACCIGDAWLIRLGMEDAEPADAART